MIPYGESTKAPIFPIVVYLIVIANIAVFAREAGGPSVAATNAFINAYAAIPYDISHNIVLPAPSPQLPLLTIFTSMFVHGGIAHIFFNMLFLVVFGPHIEYLCGHVRFLLFYLLCGFVGGIAQIVPDPGSHVPAIGASGAIAGVLGAFIYKFPTEEVNTIVPIGCWPLFLRLPAYLVIGLWFLTQLFNGYGTISAQVSSEQTGGIAYMAHIGGFIAGVFAINWLQRQTPGPRQFRYYC